MKKKKILCLLLSAIIVMGILPCYASSAGTTAEEERVPRIFVMGDSMAATYPNEEQVPQMGWGQTLQNYFDEDKLIVVNRGVGGASSRNYYTDPFKNDPTEAERHCWSTVWGNYPENPEDADFSDYLEDENVLQKGDYIIFTFGANDVKDDGEVSDEDQMTITQEWGMRNTDYTMSSDVRYVTEEYVDEETGETKTRERHSFKWYMKNYVELARSRGAIPIMITPPERRVNPSGGAFAEPSSLRYYRDAIIDLAEELNTDADTENDVVCPDTDEDNISINTLAFYKSLGDTSTGSKKLFVHLAEGQYPLYENGTVQGDNTHFRDFGAVEISRIIVEQLMNHSSTELATLKSALKTVSTPFVYDSDHNIAGTAIKQTAEKVKGTIIYPRAQFINTGDATTVQVIMAGYDADGKLTQFISADEFDVGAKSVTSFDIAYTMPDYQHAGKMKMFVWKDLDATLLPLGTNINEWEFTALQNSGNLVYESDFENGDLSDWENKNTVLATLGTSSGSNCMLLPAGSAVQGVTFNKVIPIGDAAEGAMETVFECDVKMGLNSKLSLANSLTYVFQMYRTAGDLLCYAEGYYDEDKSTWTSRNVQVGNCDPHDSEFHLKAVINEKAQTADVYIDGTLCMDDRGLYSLRSNATQIANLHISSAGGDSYIDNVVLYRQEIDTTEPVFDENFDGYGEGTKISALTGWTDGVGTAYVGKWSGGGSNGMFVPAANSHSIVYEFASAIDIGENAEFNNVAESYMETVVEFDAKLGSYTYFNLRGGSKNVFQMFAFGENLQYNGYEPATGDDGNYINSSTSMKVVKEGIVKDSPVHIKIVINEKDRTADVYYDGEKIVDNKPIYGYRYAAGTKVINKLAITSHASSTNTDSYFDNISIYRQPVGTAK